MKILDDAPLPLPHSVPQPIKEVINKALDKNCAERYNSAAEMRAALVEACEETRKAESFANQGIEYLKKKNHLAVREVSLPRTSSGP